MRTAAVLRSTIYRALVIVLTALTVLGGAMPAPVYAGDSDQQVKTVRVGWLVSNRGFQEGTPGERLSGWGYEYLQTLSYYTPGWQYEYVSGTFTELMDKLEAGEIDLMPNISYSEERAQKLLFSSNPEGTERYYIYARPDRDDLAKGDPQALQGLTIGYNPGAMQTFVDQQWLANEGITCTYKEINTGGALFEALADGEVDAVIMNDTISSPDASPMFYVGSSDYYFAVPKSRPDLMNDINAAMTAIARVNPRYNDEVKSSYSAQNSGSSSLTGTETSWLKANGNTITIGYLKNQLPYCTQNDDGEMEGSLASLATTLRDKFGITVKTVAISNNKQMVKALSNGTIDVALPLFRDYWLAEQKGVVQSNPMGTVSLTAIHSSNNLNRDLKKIACTQSAIVNRLELESLFPDATITEYPNGGEALKALNKGEASCIIVPSTRLETIRDTYGIEDFETQELTNTAQLSCLISRGKPELLGIINKGIVNAGESLSASSYSPTSYSAQESDAFRLLYRNRIVISAVVICILLTGIVILVWSLHRAQKEQQKADAANAAKTAFLTRMSHDIRTPLNGILGLIEIEELKDGDMQVARESRAKARVAANHLLSLINDILEMGKIKDRKLTLEHAPFNLKELCDDALVLCKLRASGNGITLQDNSLPYATGPYMIGSPTHIRRIIINLLDNSIKYNKRGGSVTFSSQTKPLDDGRALFCFSVSDTGIGMAPEFLKHIYEPFAQEGDDARSKFQGTGMGMPIVKSLIDLMGGTIEISSEVGAGSTFNVQIPLDIDKNPQARERADGQANSCSLAGMNVLLAEDNELNAEIAQALLESGGIVVTRTADGNETVDLYVGRPAGSFDAILMDIMMPGMDGYEATRAIRLSEKADAADIPIIALTANAFAEDAQAAHDAGMNAHLPKPLDFNKLKNMLARIKKYGSVSL
ncbi:transporter substrate-binding domain-containing protein [Collinsella aerofaciens]|uniref:ATP-binding protein n=1 Tax=Collinsella aerofaciens TaxID=74426 RepID=UPI00232B5C29|nr:transporter substrate-binding domain-containing protein [Collinsella aerofaciens]MDB1902707.1 transporter substrate-binding domain-containing protein [Collinsella aerofaciens]